jgi:uncharacterized protein YdhG (YjbR/CyaY superfamily)
MIAPVARATERAAAAVGRTSGTARADEEAALEAYLGRLSPTVRRELDAVRARIRAVVPEATEGLSYGIPTFRLAGRYLVYVAAWKRHLSLYPVPHGDAALQDQLEPYRSGRGTLRFAHGTPIPDGLVERIVAALVAERGTSAG